MSRLVSKIKASLSLGLVAAACSACTASGGRSGADDDRPSRDPLLAELAADASIYVKLEPKALGSFDATWDKIDEISGGRADELVSSEAVDSSPAVAIVRELLDRDARWVEVDYERPWFLAVLPGGLDGLEESLRLGVVPTETSGPRFLRAQALLPSSDPKKTKAHIEARLAEGTTDVLGAHVVALESLVRIELFVKGASVPDVEISPATASWLEARPASARRASPSWSAFLEHEGLLSHYVDVEGLRRLVAISGWIELMSQAQKAPNPTQRTLVFAMGVEKILTNWMIFDPYSLEFEDLAVLVDADPAGGVLLDGVLSMTKYGVSMHDSELDAVELPSPLSRDPFLELSWAVDVAEVLTSSRVPRWLPQGQTGQVEDLIDSLDRSGAAGMLAGILNGGGVLKWLGDRDPTLEPMIVADPRALEVRLYPAKTKEDEAGRVLESKAAVSVLFGNLGPSAQQIESSIRELSQVLGGMGAQTDYEVSDYALDPQRKGQLLRWVLNGTIDELYPPSQPQRPVVGGALRILLDQLPKEAVELAESEAAPGPPPGFPPDAEPTRPDEARPESAPVNPAKALLAMGDLSVRWRSAGDHYLFRAHWGASTVGEPQAHSVAGFEPREVDVEKSGCEIDRARLVIHAMQAVLRAPEAEIEGLVPEIRREHAARLSCVGTRTIDPERVRTLVDEFFGMLGQERHDPSSVH